MEELRECCAVSEEQPAKKIGNKKHGDTFFIRIAICNLFINQFRCKMLRKEIKAVKGDGIKRRVAELIMTMQICQCVLRPILLVDCVSCQSAHKLTTAHFSNSFYSC